MSNHEKTGVEYVLSFDNSVLHAEWQNEGDFLSHDGASTNVYINNINNGAGIVAFDVIVYTAGDANGDGKVNILDATIVGLEWGEETTCGAYCWDGHDRADLNNEGKVNILDAVIIGTCWGHTA